MRKVLAIALTCTMGAAAFGQGPRAQATGPNSGPGNRGPGGGGGGIAGALIWDNGADALSNIMASQLETVYPFDAQEADDFIPPVGPNGEPKWDVKRITWNGAYFNGANGLFDMRVIVYADDGTGMRPTGGPGDPTGTAIYVEDFSNAASSETPTALDGFGNQHYSYDVTLTGPLVLQAGTKYWFAAQSVGIFPPQWGFAISAASQLNEGQFGFPLLGTNYWTPNTAVFGVPNDASFAFHGNAIPEPATLSLLAVGGLMLLRRRR